MRRMLMVGAVLAVALVTSRETYAQSGETIVDPPAPSGFGALVVEQISPSDIMGLWTMLQPENGRAVSAEKIKSFSDMPAGTYTLIVEPPEGAIAVIRLYNRGEELKQVDRPQITFTMNGGDSLKVNINYTFTRVGTVSVSSDPLGIEFTLSGPNGMNVKGTTPMSYLNVAEGQYKVQYGTLEGCPLPPPKASQLEKNKRVSFDMKFSCSAADKLRNRTVETEDKYLTQTVEGQELTFRDVPQNAWFTSDVFKAARAGVLGGYKDENGVLTGEFGPSNDVTVAELAKIAHRMAGTVETPPPGGPANVAAQGQWFSSFIGSAEEHAWTIYADGSIDPVRPATRGEVLVTILQALGVPLEWQTGSVFTDVNVKTPYASAIETAARLGLVDGRKNEAGELTGEFGPLDPVNRAEMAKIINTTNDILLKKAAEEAKTKK